MLIAKRGKQVNSIACRDDFAVNIMASQAKRMIAQIRLAFFTTEFGDHDFYLAQLQMSIVCLERPNGIIKEIMGQRIYYFDFVKSCETPK